jgi:small GTP-binding protein
MARARFLQSFKLTIIGDPAVGKTSLISKFTKGFAPNKYLITIGVHITTYQAEVNNRKINLSIFDIAGQSKYHLARKQFFNGSHGTLAVFDLTSLESLNSVGTWVDELKESNEPNIPVIVLGNKSDLNHKLDLTEIHKVLAGFNIPKERFLETSALDGSNVKKAFHQISSLILNQYGAVNGEKPPLD